jgi:hypothetical protein
MFAPRSVSVMSRRQEDVTRPRSTNPSICANLFCGLTFGAVK